MTHNIRPAEPSDLPHFAAIEQAAGALFSEAGLPEIAAHEPTDIEFIQAAARTGAVFVATDDDTPVGFILSAPLDRAMHIYELSVHPAHGRKRLGRRLVESVCGWSNDKGYPAVTLSTFRDLPWNAPFYASCGFRELERREWTPALLLAHYHESDMGLLLERRCFMRKDL